ncbi:MAG: TlpA disulfide reductase family protein [Pseudomonadota bacterium]
MKRFKSIIALVILVSICLCACETEGEQLSTKTVKKVAPLFSVRDISGNTISLDGLRGKVVLINFFATWCGPCRAEIPDFVRLYKKYNPQGLEIIGLSLDQGNPGILNKFLEKYHVQYPIALATKDIIYKYGGISAIPTTVVIDQNGMIDQTIVGLRSGKMFETMVVRLLKRL